MKTKIWVLIVASFCFLGLNARQVTEEEYVALDNALWVNYEDDINKLLEEAKENPDRKDSLYNVIHEMEQYTAKENMRLAVEFATTPSGFQRVYMLRLRFDKDSLESILSGVPQHMRESPDGKSIRMHLDNDQVVEGSKYYEFTGKDSEGKDFVLSSLEGKHILLLYGGLGCMGPRGREELNGLLDDTSRDSLILVVYQHAHDVDGLKEIKERYGIDCTMISDFKGDHTPFKILYGAQGMPTCFLINPNGTVVMKTSGFHVERVRELLTL